MKKNKCYVVYAHLFPDGDVYIGLTKQKPEIRWGSNGFGYKKQPIFDKICAFGWDNIKHVILKDGLTLNEAQTLEQSLIEKYKELNMSCNVAKGGGAGGNPWCTYEYNGQIYTGEELLKLSDVENLTEHDISTRVNHHGWSIHDAITRPKMKKDYVYEYNGDLYTVAELLQFSKVEGLTTQKLYTRLNKHKWDVERALTQPLNVKKQPKGLGDRIYEYKGAMYNSYELSQMSNIENLTPFDITDRINHHGWSVERAISQPKRKSPKNKV